MVKKKPASLTIRNSTAEFLIFTTQSGKDSIEVRYEDETIWLTQKMMAELFAVSIPTINEHLKNIFASNELASNSVIRKFRITATDSKKYETKLYNLDAIISVGYRVNSVRATTVINQAACITVGNNNVEVVDKNFITKEESVKNIITSIEEQLDQQFPLQAVRVFPKSQGTLIKRIIL